MTGLWTGLAGLARRFALPLAAAAVVGLGLALILAGWRSGAEEQAGREVVRQRAAGEVSRAGETATGAALNATAQYGERELGRAALEQETRDAVLSAPDAGVDAGAAGDAGLAGLCRRAAYRDHPRCAGLRGADPAAAAR